jgi:predicted nucleotidyltransferase component of viral defense system
LDISREQEIIEAIDTILIRHGDIKNRQIGKMLHRWVFRYDERSMNIKVELNKREILHNTYEYITIDNLSIRCMNPSSMFSNKMVALSNRRYPRDLYDVYFFASRHWQLDEKIIYARTQQSIPELINHIISQLHIYFGSHQILHGL